MAVNMIWLLDVPALPSSRVDPARLRQIDSIWGRLKHS